MAERFREKVNLQPISTGTGAAPGMMSLVQKLEHFKNFAYQKAAEIGTEQAIERGVTAAGKVQLEKKDGITQAPRFKEKKFVGGVEINAYNKTLRNAYLASLDNDNRETLGRIVSENPDNLIGFNEQAEAYKKAIVQSVDPSVRDTVQMDLDSKISSLRIRVQSADVKKQMTEARRISEDNIISAVNEASVQVRNGDYTGDVLASSEILKAFTTLEGGIESGFWDRPYVNQKKREIERDVTAQKYLGEVDNKADENIQNAYDYLDELAGRVRKGFTPDEWRNLVIEGQQNVNRKAARQHRDQKAFLKQYEENMSIERGKMFMNPDIPADPSKSSQDRKDVNAAYAVVSQEWKGLSPAEQYQANLNFIKNTGIMPDGIIRNTNATMRSGNIQQVAAYSALINDIAKDPNAANILRDLPSESRAVAKQVSDSVTAGIDVETAVEIARKNTYGLTESEKESIKLKVREVTPELGNMLQVKMNETWDQSWVPFMDEEPDTTPEMQADFNVNFERFMVQTNGNQEQSSDLAWEAVRRVWGPTQIGGEKRVEKYAPYVFYGVPGVRWGWISEQFEANVKDMGVDPGKTRITIIPESLSTDNPAWYVMYEGEDGQVDMLTDDEGLPLEWYPDFKESRDYHKYRREMGEEVETAKAARQKIESLEEVMRRDDADLVKMIEGNDAI